MKLLSSRKPIAKKNPFTSVNRLETRFSLITKAEKITFASDDILYPVKYHSGLEFRILPSSSGFTMQALLDDKLVGEIKVVFDCDMARLQSSRILREFHRLGICQTLVYEAGKIALAEYGAKQFVAEVEEDSRIATIFHSLGFRTR
ncbi:MAG: hypothetical protein P1V20_08985 [Verrucomicrobiales bacterium]|nr:hypothetical protein [Verrucomicrobiales bacterium]